MTDLDNLVQNVQDYFQKKYGADTGSLGPGSLFLAFEKLGTPIAANDFKLPGNPDFNPAIALQHGSGIVDFSAGLDPDGFILPRGDLSPKVTGEYDALLSDANYLSQSANDPALGNFMQLKGQARRLFDESKATMAPQFWPANFTPQYWFNDQDPTIWSNYNYSTGEPTQPGAGPTPTPPSRVILGDWRWRVVTPEAAPNWEAVSRLQSVHPAEMLNASVLTTRVVGAPSSIELAAVSPPASTAIDPRIVPFILSASGTDTPSRRVTPFVAKHMALETVVLDLPAQHVSSSNFNLSFDYCVATVARPWLSANLLSAARWYIPGVKSGSLAGGKYENSAQPFAFLPAKLIVVKNLVVSAEWSEEDHTYAQNAASLGPFALIDKSFEGESGKESLKSPGMQIFAWLCQVMPLLPPVSDPGLGTPSTTPG